MVSDVLMAAGIRRNAIEHPNHRMQAIPAFKERWGIATRRAWRSGVGLTNQKLPIIDRFLDLITAKPDSSPKLDQDFRRVAAHTSPTPPVPSGRPVRSGGGGVVRLSGGGVATADARGLGDRCP